MKGMLLAAAIVAHQGCKLVTVNYGPGVPLEQVLVCDYPSSKYEVEIQPLLPPERR